MRALLVIAVAFICALACGAGCGGGDEASTPPDQGLSSTQIAAEVTPGARPPAALPPATPESPRVPRGLPPPAADAGPAPEGS